MCYCSGGKVYKGTKNPEIGFKKWKYTKEGKEDPLVKYIHQTQRYKNKDLKIDENIIMFHQDTWDIPNTLILKKKKKIIFLRNFAKYVFLNFFEFF